VRKVQIHSFLERPGGKISWLDLKEGEESSNPQFFGRPGGNISKMALRVGEESPNPHVISARWL
jgi:hypothetical protein